MGGLVSTAIRPESGRSGEGFRQGSRVSNPAELLARLTTHGIMIGHIPGGTPELLTLDIAGALGMMHDKRGAAMLLAKYTLDGEAMRACMAHWRMMVAREAYRNGWVHPERQRAVADYTYGEWLDAQRCRSCKGVGEQMTEHGKVLKCDACEGTGLRKIGLRAPARALGMSAEGYRKSAWPTRVDWARRELIGIEHRALASLARRIGRR